MQRHALGCVTFLKKIEVKSDSRQKHSVGSLVTLMTVDLDRVFIGYNSQIGCSCLLQLYFLYHISLCEIGVLPSLAGCVVLVTSPYFRTTLPWCLRGRMGVKYREKSAFDRRVIAALG